MKNYITVQELSEMLKVTTQTVFNWRKEGMPCEKFGKIIRFEEDKVLDWLRNR